MLKIIRQIMFHTKQKRKPIYPSEVHPTGKLTKKPQETFSQTLMNYEILTDKVQTQFQSKPIPQKATSKNQAAKRNY